MLRTNRTLTFKRNRSEYEAPKGAEVEPVTDEPGVYWIKPETFEVGSMAHHHATYYGFRVKAVDVEAVPEGWDKV